MSEELKCCPLCGYMARMTKPTKPNKTEIGAGFGPLFFGVECAANLDCGARLDRFSSQEDAITAWNRRHGEGV